MSAGSPWRGSPRSGVDRRSSEAASALARLQRLPADPPGNRPAWPARVAIGVLLERRGQAFGGTQVITLPIGSRLAILEIGVTAEAAGVCSRERSERLRRRARKGLAAEPVGFEPSGPATATRTYPVLPRRTEDGAQPHRRYSRRHVGLPATPLLAHRWYMRSDYGIPSQAPGSADSRINPSPSSILAGDVGERPRGSATHRPLGGRLPRRESAGRGSADREILASLQLPGSPPRPG